MTIYLFGCCMVYNDTKDQKETNIFYIYKLNNDSALFLPVKALSIMSSFGYYFLVMTGPLLYVLFIITGAEELCKIFINFYRKIYNGTLN